MATSASLNIESNEFFEWCVRRLEKRYGSRSKHVLGVWQSAAAYYSAISVKRASVGIPQTFAQGVNNAKATEAYEKFVVPAMMQWADEQDHAFPTWLTKDLMGRSTLDGERKLYNPKMRALWSKFSEARRLITTEWNPAYDRFLVDGQLPPGSHMSDIALHVHKKIWELQPGSKKKVRRDHPFAPTAPTNPTDGESGPPPNPSDIVTVDVPMPDDYLHEVSLTFALFGRPSSSEDSNLKLDPNAASRGKKRKAGTGSADDAGGYEGWGGSGDGVSNELPESSKLVALSSQALKMMAAVGEAQIRKDSRKASAKAHAAAPSWQGSFDRVLGLLEQTDHEQARMISAVTNINDFLKKKEDRKARQLAKNEARAAKRLAIKTLKDQIRLSEDLGMAAEAHGFKKKLLALFKATTVAASVPEMPVLAETPVLAAPVADVASTLPPVPTRFAEAKPTRSNGDDCDNTLSMAEDSSQSPLVPGFSKADPAGSGGHRTGSEIEVISC